MSCRPVGGNGCIQPLPSFQLHYRKHQIKNIATLISQLIKERQGIARDISYSYYNTKLFCL